MTKRQAAHISKDDVENLSHGNPTRSKVGDISLGHRLTKKERLLFEAAKRNGYLKIPVSGLRMNVRNIYLKWCEATNTVPVIRDGHQK